MKAILQFLVYSNLLISFGAGILSSGIAYFFGHQNHISYLLFAFGATLFIYNAQRILRLTELINTSSPRHHWIIRNKYLVVFLSVLGASIALFYFIHDFFHIKSFIFLILFAAISIFYSFRIKTNLPTLREIPFLKIHWIALTWTACCVLFPILYVKPVTLEFSCLIIGIYFYFIGITIPFDIRDLPYDSQKQKTIPQLLNVKNSLRLALFLVLTSFVMLVAFNYFFLNNPFFYLAYAYQIVFIYFSKRERKEMYYSAVIDGGIIFLGVSFY